MNTLRAWCFLPLVIMACPESPGPTPPSPDIDDTDVAVEDDIPIEQRRVTIFLNGIGSGIITSEPEGIECGSSCSTEFDIGTEIELRVKPSIGHRFAGFSGDTCVGLEVCRFTIEANVEVGVTWEPTSLSVSGASVWDDGAPAAVTGLAAASSGTMFAMSGESEVTLTRLSSASGTPARDWQLQLGQTETDCPVVPMVSLSTMHAVVAGQGGAQFNLDPSGSSAVSGAGTFVAAYTDAGIYDRAHVSNGGCPKALAARGDVVAWTGEVSGTGAAIVDDLGTNDTAISCVIAAYDAATLSPTWSRAIGTADFDVARGRAIAVDEDESLIVAARVVNTGALDFGGGPMPDGSAVVLARYDAAGNHVWSQNYGGINHDIVSLDIMAGGDLLVSGLERRGAQEVAFVTRLDAQGQQRWIATLDYSDNQAATATTVTEDGSVLVAGWRYSGGPPYAEVTLTQLTADGLMLWRQQLGSSTGEERALALNHGPSGIWLGGWFEGDQPWTLNADNVLSAETRSGFALIVEQP